jgi:signal transduction histidine kinase
MNQLRWENEWLRFLNVIILNRFWEVTFQNITQNFDGDIDFEKFYKKNGVVNHEGNFIKTQKLPLTWETLIFIKKKWYDWDEFLQELFLFLLLCFVLSVWFYFVGLYFSGKILKPVEENISDMNDFIHNAWHELKTPLAVTSSNLQLLSQLKIYDAELITSSIWEIKRMDQLIVWLSQLSDIQTFSHQEKFSLNDSIDQIISEYYSKIQEKNLIVSKELENISFFWNKTYFEILFANLFSNALKYNHENWKINITLTKKYLRIENTGNIITDEQKEKIFERFYRIETARSAEWFGIWLSLVKKICDIFSWKISVKNTQSTNIFEIEL